MRWKKAPEELTRRFAALLPKHPDVTPKKMFGYACAFVRGNFWIGLHESNVVVRLPDGLNARFPAVASAKPFDPMGGRPMSGWFVVPREVVAQDAKLERFMADTLAAVLELPAKAPKRAPAKRTAPKKKARPARASKA